MPPSGETKREILDAARRFLWDRPFREMTVAELMDPLSVGRSAFYIYFDDRYALAAELLDMVEREILEASEEARTRGPSPERLRTAVRDVVQVWVRHGPVTRAISEASSQDQTLEDLYRWGFIQRMIDRLTKIVEQSREGADAVDDASETGVLLAFMLERYLCDQLGRHPQADPDRLSRTLIHAFESVIYGRRTGAGSW